MITMSAEEIHTTLSNNHLGHLGCIHNGQPFVFPMAYGYYDNVIYGQTTVGKKVQILRNNPRACFQVDVIDGAYWSSVICWGEFEELNFNKLETKEAQYLTQILTQRLQSLQKVYGISIEFTDRGALRPLKMHGRESVLFRIPITSCSGIRHEVT